MAGVVYKSIRAAVAAFVMAGLASATAALAQQPPIGVREISEQMLVDGMDAAIDGDVTKARVIFEKLIAFHPRSPAARKAAAEVDKLNAAAVRHSEDDEIPAGDASEALRKIRFKFVSEVGDRVFFAENSAVIGGRARAILEAQARWLKNAPLLGVTILGRADDGGSAEDARALAQMRAEAVQVKLVQGGVPASRIKIEVKGTSDPVATCRSSLCQAQNRNAETQLRFSDQHDMGPGFFAGELPEARGAAAAGSAGRALAR